MASGICRVAPLLFSCNSGGFEATKSSDVYKNQKEAGGLTVENSCGRAENLIKIMELRKKIMTFRDIIDLPPCYGTHPINELVMRTVEDLHKLYPKIIPSKPILEINESSLHQVLACLYNALKSIGDLWAKNHKWLAKFQHDQDDNMENHDLEQFGESVLAKLDYMIKVAQEMFDVMDEEEQKNDENPQDTSFGDFLTESYSDSKTTCLSPVTPTSVLLEIGEGSIKGGEFADVSYSPPLLWPLRLQAVGNLKPIDIKRLSFHMPPYISALASSPVNEIQKQVNESNIEIQEATSTSETISITNEGPNGSQIVVGKPIYPKCKSNVMNRNIGGSESSDADPKSTLPSMTVPTLVARGSLEASTRPPPPMLPTNVSSSSPQQLPPLPPPMLLTNVSSTSSLSPPPASMLPAKISSLSSPTNPPPSKVSVTAAPPPPPLLPSKGSMQSTSASISLAKGAAPPPPPPLGVTKSLRPKKANTKLKRSSHMGNLYRVLKGKVEGSSLDGKLLSRGRKRQIGGPADGKQGMADALAEITKRSAYFQQIEKDVQKHAKTIMELKAAINKFQTKEMSELLKFHKYVELQLENLTDETQVLARFEGFPMKKLETLRTAAALYLKLDSMVTTLESWKVVAPSGQLLDKVDSYFNKIKAEVDTMERSKDEESKRFQSHNINFDFHILTRIKECMVDVSSGCMELALKERREAKAAASGDTEYKNGARSKACAKTLWRAFQLAFRVYTFAGGQDDRADRLTRELAHEIETDPQNQ